MNKRRWGCLVLLAAMLLGVIVLLSGVLRPEAAPEDLQTRSRTQATRDPKVAFTIGGMVIDADDKGVPDVVIEVITSDETTRWQAITDEDGRFMVRDVAGVVDVNPQVDTIPASQMLIHPRTDLVFRIAQACSLLVRTYNAGPGEQEVREATATLYASSGEVFEMALDEGGAGTWEDVPCGPATLEVRADGYLPNSEPVLVDADRALVGLYPTQLGLVRVHGTVTSEGMPVAGAELGAVPEGTGRTGYSGPDGVYSIFVDGPGPYSLIAEHSDHQYEFDALLVPPGVEQWEHDVELEPIRKVKVYCAGLPEDDCHDLPLVMCSESWAPAGFPCEEEGSDITCRCPLTEAAIRGGGESVLVPPEATEAWLDFRTPGGIVGQVLVDGEPTPCSLEVVRWSLELSGGGGLRTHACEKDGEFVIPSLKAGSWRVVARAQGMEQAIGPIEVFDTIIDVGEVDLMGGVMLSGRVLWEDSEEPVADASVAAVELDALSDGAAPPVGTATTAADGSFSIFGLEPGRYQVMLPRDPGGAQVVQLDEEDVYVELFREGSSGLSLRRDDDDRLIIAEGDDAGWLQPGDRLEGVEVAGIDVLGMVPRYGDGVGETLLGLVGWPGITVVVERDGQTVEVGSE